MKTLTVIITTLFMATAFPLPLRSEIDPQYKDRLADLTTRLLSDGFSKEDLERIFSDERVELYPQILDRSGKGLPYFSKKFGLLTKRSISRGCSFLSNNMDILRKVEQFYGVEKEIIVAILRIETNFNNYVGKYPIFNSLLTLALAENKRSVWAEGELTELLRIAKTLDKDPLSIKGSWAGAFGMAQFIPSSYTKYAVDGNNDGVIDLFELSDAAASIANYLRAHGWEKSNTDKNRKAVFAYNHCDEYVKAVFAYARSLKASQPVKKRAPS